MSFKGGVAKTTTCINLAQFFGSRRGGKHTYLIDGDSNRTAINFYNRGLQKGVQASFSICDAEGILPERYDNLIIDTPARPTDQEIQELIKISDLIVVPTATTAEALEGAIGMMTRLSAVPPGKVWMLLTLVPPAPSKRGQTFLTDLKQANLPVLNGWIQRREVFVDAGMSGTPVGILKGLAASKAANDYSQVGKELANIVGKRA